MVCTFCAELAKLCIILCYVLCMCVCMYVCMYECMYVCVYVLYMYIFITYVHMSACVVCDCVHVVRALECQSKDHKFKAYQLPLEKKKKLSQLSTPQPRPK